MQIGDLLRTIIVEPLESRVGDPRGDATPLPAAPEPEPEPSPANR